MSAVHIINTVNNPPLSLHQSIPLAQQDLMLRMEHDDGHATTYTLYSERPATVFALVYTTSTAKTSCYQHGTW